MIPLYENRLAVPTWSYAIDHYKPARIIELGTYTGGLSLALGVHAWALGAKIVTYDRMAPNAEISPLAKFLGVQNRTCDLYTPETITEIRARIREPGITYLLCDGGDKKRELELYMPTLKPGDVIAAHDYDVHADPERPELLDSLPSLERPWPWNEIDAPRAREFAAKNGCAPWMQNYFDAAGWLVFQRGPA
jgi:predicted O-methyltransferase YrrM